MRLFTYGYCGLLDILLVISIVNIEKNTSFSKLTAQKSHGCCLTCIPANESLNPIAKMNYYSMNPAHSMNPALYLNCIRLKVAVLFAQFCELGIYAIPFVDPTLPYK